MRYRKRPIEIEAEIFHSKWNIPNGVQVRTVDVLGVLLKEYYIPTLEGDMIVKDCDYVITGVKGERYPCKPDIFAMTYERVEEE